MAVPASASRTRGWSPCASGRDVVITSALAPPKITSASTPVVMVSLPPVDSAARGCDDTLPRGGVPCARCLPWSPKHHVAAVVAGGDAVEPRAADDRVGAAARGDRVVAADGEVGGRGEAEGHRRGDGEAAEVAGDAVVALARVNDIAGLAAEDEVAPAERRDVHFDPAAAGGAGDRWRPR